MYAEYGCPAPLKIAQKAPHWVCLACTVENQNMHALACEVCGTQRSELSSSGASSLSGAGAVNPNANVDLVKLEEASFGSFQIESIEDKMNLLRAGLYDLNEALYSEQKKTNKINVLVASSRKQPKAAGSGTGYGGRGGRGGRGRGGRGAYGYGVPAPTHTAVPASTQREQSSDKIIAEALDNVNQALTTLLTSASNGAGAASALLPLLHSCGLGWAVSTLLRNESVDDILRRSSVYTPLMDLLQTISTEPFTVSYLTTKPLITAIRSRESQLEHMQTRKPNLPQPPLSLNNSNSSTPKAAKTKRPRLCKTRDDALEKMNRTLGEQWATSGGYDESESAETLLLSLNDMSRTFCSLASGSANGEMDGDDLKAMTLSFRVSEIASCVQRGKENALAMGLLSSNGSNANNSSSNNNGEEAYKISPEKAVADEARRAAHTPNARKQAAFLAQIAEVADDKAAIESKGRNEQLAVESTYIRELSKLRFACVGLCDMIDSKGKGQTLTHAFYRTSGSSNSSSSSSTVANPRERLRRISSEIATLSKSLPVYYGSSIFLRTDDVNMHVMKALIVGPEGTPYANGLFEFDIQLPPSYPQQPPSVQFMTTGGGTVRFNPNLYNSGKVCLSLLGTWAGPGWEPGVSTLLQVLVSIQSLILVDDPYCNEPGYEKCGGGGESVRYNRNIRVQTLRYAINGWLSWLAPSTATQTNHPHPHPLFQEVIEKHFHHKGAAILQQAQQWLLESEIESKSKSGSSNHKSQNAAETMALRQLVPVLEERLIMLAIAMDAEKVMDAEEAQTQAIAGDVPAMAVAAASVSASTSAAEVVVLDTNSSSSRKRGRDAEVINLLDLDDVEPLPLQVAALASVPESESVSAAMYMYAQEVEEEEEEGPALKKNRQDEVLDLT